jgi:BTB/POZ domain
VRQPEDNNLNGTGREETTPSGASLSSVASSAAAHGHHAYDISDDEPPVETIQDRLLWRLDPDESKIDWTIQIIIAKRTSKTENENDGTDDHANVTRSGSGGSSGTNNDDNAASNEDDPSTVVDLMMTTTTTIYHVHVRNLTVGPRRSEYFVVLLQDGGRFAESQSQTSRIQLHPMTAVAFPMLLDFMYSSEQDGPAPFTTANATALYSLANYFVAFDVFSFWPRSFWKTDVMQRTRNSVYAAETYYVHAAMLQEDTILQAATRFCKDNILKLSTCSRLLRADGHCQRLLMMQMTPCHECIAFISANSWLISSNKTTTMLR